MEDSLQLRRFNEQGLVLFNECLHLLSIGEEADPTGFLIDDNFTELVPGGSLFEVKPFKDRLEAGVQLDRIVSGLGMGFDQLRTDTALWSWLSLAWWDHLVPRKNGEFVKSFPDTKRLYLNSESMWTSYRHWLAGTWGLYRVNKEPADSGLLPVFFSGPVNVPGEVIEQFTSNRPLVLIPNVALVWNRLYWDPTAKKIKTGARGDAGGSARRLVKVMKQFEQTYDFHAMSVDEIIDLLAGANELDRFL